MRSFSGFPALRAVSWTELCGYAFVAFLMITFTKHLLPPDMTPYVRLAAVATALGLLAAKDLSHAPDAWRRLKEVAAARGPWHGYVAALLPPELVGLAKLDRQLQAGCINSILRRKPASLPEGQPLTYLSRGAYGTAMAFVFVSVFLELPAHTLILNVLIQDQAALMVLHVVGAVAVLYTLVLVIGDRWHVGAGQHVLTADSLHLHVGARTSGVLPLAAIERMESVGQALPIWRRKHGVRACDTLVVTPFDKPNCVLVLKPEAQVEILHWQVRRRLPRYVFLYVDRPELLRASLHQH